MNKFALLFGALVVSTLALAQDNVKQKEAALLLRNLDNFGVGFKTGTSTALWRFNTLLLSGASRHEDSDDDGDLKQNQFGASLSAGREYRKLLAEKLEFRYGIDLTFDISLNKYDNEDTNWYYNRKTYTPGISVVLGFNYLFSPKVAAGLEILPGISYTKGTETEGYNDDRDKKDIESFSYGFSSTYALFNVSYRF